MADARRNSAVNTCPICGEKFYGNDFELRVTAYKSHFYDHSNEEMEELFGCKMMRYRPVADY